MMTPIYDDKGLYGLFEADGIDYQLHEHPPVYTVEAALTHSGDLSGFHIKNLFLRDKKRNFFLVTAHFQRQINLKELAVTLNAKGNLSFASDERLYEILGVRPGSVTPLSLINDVNRVVTFYLDKDAPSDDALINPHPLRNDRTLQLKGRDLYQFIRKLGYEIHLF